MHLKWPSGHSRLKHGLHAISILTMLATGERGGVYTVDDEPKSAMRGTRSAAAACMRPESLLVAKVASDSKSIAVPISVRPVRSRKRCPLSAAAAITAAEAGLSLGDPMS